MLAINFLVVVGYQFSVVSKNGYQFSVVKSRFLGLYRLNAGRMNQRYECLMGIPRGEYAANLGLSRITRILGL